MVRVHHYSYRRHPNLMKSLKYCAYIDTHFFFLLRVKFFDIYFSVVYDRNLNAETLNHIYRILPDHSASSNHINKCQENLIWYHNSDHLTCIDVGLTITASAILSTTFHKACSTYTSWLRRRATGLGAVKWTKQRSCTFATHESLKAEDCLLCPCHWEFVYQILIVLQLVPAESVRLNLRAWDDKWLRKSSPTTKSLVVCSIVTLGPDPQQGSPYFVSKRSTDVSELPCTHLVCICKKYALAIKLKQRLPLP